MQRPLGILLLFFLPFVAAWRPYETVDAAATPAGQVAMEWGALTVDIGSSRWTLAAPQLLARLGAGRGLEVGLRGSYRLAMPGGKPAWEGTAVASTVGLYGKWELISGAASRSSWPRPGVSLLGGVHVLGEEAPWGLDLRGAGSLWVGPVFIHLNIGFQHHGQPGVLVGSVLTLPLSCGLTPAVEISGEVRFGERPSAASALLSFTQRLRDLPLLVDVAVRRGLTAGSADWTVTSGLTMMLQAWGPSVL